MLILFTETTVFFIENRMKHTIHCVDTVQLYIVSSAGGTRNDHSAMSLSQWQLFGKNTAF